MREYPIAIIQDRYGGIYSDGRWLAVAEADALTSNGQMRALYVLTDGPSGGDTDAMLFWVDPPDWIAAGVTPSGAVDALKDKLGLKP